MLIKALGLFAMIHENKFQVKTLKPTHTHQNISNKNIGQQINVRADGRVDTHKGINITDES